MVNAASPAEKVYRVWRIIDLVAGKVELTVQSQSAAANINVAVNKEKGPEAYENDTENI